MLEEAELDEDAEGQLARRFGREYTLLTRPERLRTIARDLVAHFVGRGFTGKAMYATLGVLLGLFALPTGSGRRIAALALLGGLGALIIDVYAY